MRHVIVRLVCLMVVAIGLAGCDTCGHALKFNTPSLPKTCGANVDDGR
jgi:hypothetical protein